MNNITIDNNHLEVGDGMDKEGNNGFDMMMGDADERSGGRENEVKLKYVKLI